MAPATHPVWSLIRLAILMTAAVLCLWINASNFDMTEIKSLIGIFLAASASEGALSRIARPDRGLTLQDGVRVDSASYWRGFKDAGGES